jgi:hypothetical protein
VRILDATQTLTSRLVKGLPLFESCIDLVKLDSVIESARQIGLRTKQWIGEGGVRPDESLILSELNRQIKKQRDEIETLLMIQSGNNTLPKLSDECESLDAKIRLGKSVVNWLA